MDSVYAWTSEALTEVVSTLGKHLQHRRKRRTLAIIILVVVIIAAKVASSDGIIPAHIAPQYS